MHTLCLYRDINLTDNSHHYSTWTILHNHKHRHVCYSSSLPKVEVQVFQFNVLQSDHFFTHCSYGKCWKCFPPTHRQALHLTYCTWHVKMLKIIQTDRKWLPTIVRWNNVPLKFIYVSHTVKIWWSRGKVLMFYDTGLRFEIAQIWCRFVVCLFHLWQW